MKRATRLAVLAMVASALPVGAAEVTVQQVDFHGWSHAWRMTNGVVDLVFVPQIGRIMRYGLLGDRNMLWVNEDLAGKPADFSVPDWQNFGGDKLWPSPQSVWNWPPDPALDRGDCAVTVTPAHHLLITGQSSAKSGVQFYREIVLSPSGTAVTLMNRMTCTADHPVTWGVWEICQTADPSPARLPLKAGGKFEAGYRLMADTPPPDGTVEVSGQDLKVHRHTAQSYKYGSEPGTGALAAVEGNCTMRLTADFPISSSYPDQGCGFELYTNPDPLKYVELELMAPVVTLQPGRTSRFVTHWNLVRNP